MKEQNGILTVAEVAAELRCSKAHVCKAINGQVKHISPLPAIAMGRRKLVRLTTLQRWMEENERALHGGKIAKSPKQNAVDA